MRFGPVSSFPKITQSHLQEPSVKVEVKRSYYYFRQFFQLNITDFYQKCKHWALSDDPYHYSVILGLQV